MSGQKISYARITQDEYERLMRSARVAENMDYKIQEELRRKEVELQSEFRAQMDILNRRNSMQEEIIETLNDNMKEMERDFQRRYRQQASKHQRDIDNLNKKIDVEIEYIHNRLDEQRQEYISLIKEQSRILNNRIDSIQRDIEAKEQSRKNQALEWLKNAEDALSLVDTYNHKKFAPNEYDDLKNRIELVKTNIKNENYEISNLQNIWMDSYKLRAKLEQLESEWNSYLQLAKQSNAELLATCEVHEVVELAFETSEDDMQLEVDINFWTSGKLDKLKAKAEKLHKNLKTPDDLEVSDFKEMIKKSLELKSQVTQLTELAKANIILSQQRADMAEDILESLEQKGFELADDCYEYDDQRKAYRIKLENAGGDEIVTIITPQDNLTNRLDIHFFDNNTDDAEKRIRLNSILKSLSQNGINCDMPQCAPGTEHKNSGDEAVRDFESIKNKKSRAI